MDEAPATQPRRNGQDRRQVRVWVGRCVRWSGLLVVLWLASSALAVHTLTQRFARAPDRVSAPAGTRLEPVETRSQDGLRLVGQVLEVPGPRAALLCLHGSGDSRRVWNRLLPHFTELNVVALMPDLRAHGESDGEFNDFGWGARADVRAWLGWLEAQHPELPRYVIGISMGSAAALFAAAEDGPPVAGYLLESCYQDLDTAQRNRLRERLPGPLADLAAAGMRLVAPLFFDFDVQRDSPLDRARSLGQRGHGPAIVLGTRGDLWASAAEQAALADALGENTRLVLVAGHGHIALLGRDLAGYADLLSQLLGN